MPSGIPQSRHNRERAALQRRVKQAEGAHPCAFCEQEPALSLPKGWDTPKPAAHAFEVDVARVERTLLSAAFDFDLASGHTIHRASTTGKGTTFSRAEARTTVEERRAKQAEWSRPQACVKANPYELGLTPEAARLIK